MRRGSHCSFPLRRSSTPADIEQNHLRVQNTRAGRRPEERLRRSQILASASVAKLAPAADGGVNTPQGPGSTIVYCRRIGLRHGFDSYRID